MTAEEMRTLLPSREGDMSRGGDRFGVYIQAVDEREDAAWWQRRYGGEADAGMTVDDTILSEESDSEHDAEDDALPNLPSFGSTVTQSPGSPGPRPPLSPRPVSARDRSTDRTTSVSRDRSLSPAPRRPDAECPASPSVPRGSSPPARRPSSSRLTPHTAMRMERASSPGGSRAERAQSPLVRASGVKQPAQRVVDYMTGRLRAEDDE